MIDAADDPRRRLAEELRKQAELRRKAKRAIGEAAGGGRSYEVHRADAAARNKAMSAAGRDLGKMPPVANWRRRRKCVRHFREFCETYGAKVFHLAWSPDHLRVLSKLATAIETGGQFALAMPRGSGKTTMVVWATLWAMLTGRRRMVVIVGADATAGAQILEAIAGEVETNDLLLADFPEVCYPMRKLEGIHQRAHGQLCLGRLTKIGLTADELVLPTVPRDAVERAEQMRGGGCVVRTVGITGRIRGMQARTAEGAIVRPSLVLLDDPQTDESAKSPSQCDYRERIIAGAILGMAGPGVRMAALATVTVIRPDDLADRLLTPQRHPDWQSERTRLVYEWGEGVELWQTYSDIRRDPERGVAAANEFYMANRAAMDAGARVGWEQRKQPDEISAIQSAWNLRIDRGEDAFWSEYQNEPISETRKSVGSIDPEIVLERVYRTPRGTVPSEASLVTAGIDVQGSVIYWMLCGWTDDGRGWIVDYGTVPEQPGDRLGLTEIATTLAAIMPEGSEEQRIANGCRLAIERVSQDSKTETGGLLRPDRILIDAGWGQHTTTVRGVVKASRAPVNSSKGYAIGAKHSRGISEGKRRPGERVGLNWRMTDAVRSGLGVREVMFDANFWKTWVAARFRTPAGSPGSFEVCGDRLADIRRHSKLAEQLAAEEAVLVEAKGRRVEEWMLRRVGSDNHLFDCLVLASVAASISGVRVADTDRERQSSYEVEEISLASVQGRR